MLKIKPKKELGQNFLKDNRVIEAMLKALDLKKDNVLVEIGGGKGAITKALTEKRNTYQKLDVYELDSELISSLRRMVREDSKINIIQANFLKANLSKYKSSWKVIGSIPYYITSPIIHQLLNLQNRPEIIVLLIQKEVANKMLAKAPKSTYWTYITLGYDVKKIVDVPSEAFSPEPKVQSAVVKLTRNVGKEKLTKNIGPKRWEAFLHRAYKHPRKMLNKAFDTEVLKKCNIDPTWRPQNITLDQWIQLCDTI